METKEYKLGELAKFSNGINFDKNAYFGNGIRLITVSDFGNNFTPDYESLIEVSKEVVKEKDLISKNDILFVRSNGNKELVGRCMLIDNVDKPTTYSGFCIKCHFDNENISNPKYFTYYFKNQYFRKCISNASGGTNIQNLNQEILSKHKVHLPHLATQQKIASILSTYDNLIQNYKKQIEDLQTCASELYKEWFVRFRFPGYQTTQFENGIPVGWKVEKLFDVAKIIYGYPFNSDEFCNDNSLNPVVRIRDILDNHTETYTSESCDEKYLINPNEMLIGMDGIFHMTLWTGKKAYQNQRTVRIISKKKNLSNYFLYFALYPQIKALEQMIVGTTVAHLGDKHLKKVTVLLPDESLLKKSFERLEPNMNRIYSLQQQITNLTQQRDLLLPRLMSGKLEVK